ncbi:peptidase inhibitor family I36 [Saccharothrix carnea]|uniref:Peptidase inhibitor family I36 n=1 Tax=Saccharothrix carnea TaxID=1280637 RepID=A0A2P8HLQ2_SACCR|nr:peptidase inhibitor family I36 protein [Saccharothrix carnea]PSL47149.1 peptidase inhibitor family I36 [Saccharothrix carnea]
MNRFRSTLAALGLAMIALTSPAAAQTQSPGAVEPLAFADCPSGYFCVWEHADGTGHWARFRTGSSDLTVPIGGFVFNDEISSVWNRTSRIWCLYENIDYGPPALRIAVNWRGPLGPRYDFNDKVSSLKPC